jgi:hypothetical protein
MSRLPVQATRFQRLLERGNALALDGFRGSWRRRSLALLSLLLGIYSGNNLTAVLLYWIRPRPLVVLLVVVVIELIVRVRSHWLKGEPSLGWVICDNLRLGLVYAVVLEAFKLGS